MTIVKSVIVIPHKNNCEALEWVKSGMSPIEWNVRQFFSRTCDENGNELTEEELIEKGTGYLFYEFYCGDRDCPARKRVNAQDVAKM